MRRLINIFLLASLGSCQETGNTWFAVTADHFLAAQGGAPIKLPDPRMNDLGPDDLAFIRKPIVGDESLQDVLDAITAAAKSSKIITLEVQGDIADADRFLIVKNGIRACIDEEQLNQTIPAVFFAGEMASLIDQDATVKQPEHPTGHLDFCKSCKHESAGVLLEDGVDEEHFVLDCTSEKDRQALADVLKADAEKQAEAFTEDAASHRQLQEEAAQTEVTEEEMTTDEMTTSEETTATEVTELDVAVADWQPVDESDAILEILPSLRREEQEESTAEAHTTVEEDERLLAPLTPHLYRHDQNPHTPRLADINNPSLVERGQMVPESIKKHTGVKVGRGLEEEESETTTAKPKSKKKKKASAVETTESVVETTTEKAGLQFLDSVGQSLGSFGASIPDVIDNAFGHWNAPNFGHIGGFFNQTTPKPEKNVSTDEDETTESSGDEEEREVSLLGLGNLLGGNMSAELINQAAASGNLEELTRLASHLPPGTLTSLLKSSLTQKAKDELEKLGYDETTEDLESRMLDEEDKTGDGDGDVEQSVGILNELANEGAFKKLISAVARMPAAAFDTVIAPLLSPKAKSVLESMGLMSAKEAEAETTGEIELETTDLVTETDKSEQASRDLTERNVIRLWVVEFEHAALTRDIPRLQQLMDSLPEDALEILIAPWLEEETIQILQDLDFLASSYDRYPRYDPDQDDLSDLWEEEQLKRAQIVYAAVTSRVVPPLVLSHPPPFHH